ncbi:hypothetical protein [Saccharospirillum sp.]|uniref:hypothetical protein n=1 Tax=Saccharospirillum sp. TaxID=2033801 RepID=UPI0034A09585
MSDTTEFLTNLSKSIRTKVKAIFSGIDDYIDDRLKSPFIWSFILSWLVINWEIPAKIVFENEDVDVEWLTIQISSIEQHEYLIPLLFSFSYVIILRPLFSLLGGFGKWMMGASQKFNDFILKRQPIHHAELVKERRRAKYFRETASSEFIELEELRKKYDALRAESEISDDALNASKEEAKYLTVKLKEQERIAEGLTSVIDVYLEEGRLINKEIKEFMKENPRLKSTRIDNIFSRLNLFRKNISNSSSSEDNNEYSSKIKMTFDNNTPFEENFEDSNNKYFVEKRVLLSLYDAEWFNQVEVAENLGLKDVEVEDALAAIVASGWANKQRDGYRLTTRGKERISAIVDESDQSLPELNHDHLNRLREIILEHLSYTPLSERDIKSKMKLFWNIEILLEELINKGDIEKSGELYRIK